MSVSAFPYAVIVSAVGDGLSAQLPADSTSYFHKSTDLFTCYAGIILKSNGQCMHRGPDGAAETYIFDWMLSGAATDYWVRCTLNSGSLYASSATGSFITSDSFRSWQVADFDNGISSVDADFDIDIATDSGGSNIIATQNYTPSANYWDPA